MLGSNIYNVSPTNGFLYCVIATTLVYALILPLILLVPKELIATAEGEPNPRVAAEVLEEIAETGPAEAPENTPVIAPVQNCPF